MGPFANIANDLKLLTIIVNGSIVDFYQGPECTSESSAKSSDLAPFISHTIFVESNKM